MEPRIVSHELNFTQIHLRSLRCALLVTLNRGYPKRLPFAELRCHHTDTGSISLKRELAYLRELHFVHKRGKRWKITANGRDFLLGLVEAKGIQEPALMGSIGEK